MKNPLFIATFFLYLPFTYAQESNSEAVKESIINNKAEVLTEGLAPGDIAELEASINQGISNINSFVDSLNALNIPITDYQSKLDSAFNRLDLDILQKARTRGDSIGENLMESIRKLDKSMNEKRVKIDSLLQRGEKTLPESVKAGIKLPSFMSSKIDSPEIPSFPGLPEFPTDLGDIPSPLKMTSPSLSGIDLKDAEKIAGDVDEIMAMGNQVDIPSQQNIDQRIEEAALRVREVEELHQASSSISKLSGELKDISDAAEGEGIAKEVRLRAKKKFVDHFAGQEQKLESEMASMEKLQRKYHSLTDVRYLPKRRTNYEKGKPFIERVIVGTSFQVNRSDPKWTGLDISPYAGYKFSDRFRASLGATYRVTFDMKTFEFSEESRVYGYRAFAQHKIISGWFGHLEVETLKMKIPGHFAQHINLKDPDRPVWVPMAYIGLFKTYSLGPRIQGQSQILYDFLAVTRNFDFNKISVRFGFEYKFKKKKR